MKRPILFFIFIIILVTSIVACRNDSSVRVERVIDGDTIVLEGGDRVRILGIDTPEKNEEGFTEAREFAIDMLFNKKVKLQKDTLASESDWYGRLLRYVYVEGQPYSEAILKECLAVPFGVHSQKMRYEDLHKRNCE